MMRRRLPAILRRLAPATAFCALALAAAAAVPAPGGPAARPAAEEGPRPAVPPAAAGAASATWKEVEELMAEDRYQAALDKVLEIRDAAREAGDVESWTRALIEELQLRTALHGYTGAVRSLRDQPWPEAPHARALVQLFYARSLVNYLHAYSWEIRQRERVESGEELDPESWTGEQIFAAAQEAFGEVWQRRDQWGARPLGDWAVFIDENNYPPRIRGTLRDVVTYLWVDTLADSSLWRPAHAAESYRLDLEHLLGGPEAVDLADPDLHPLSKIAALLADLEAWHRAAGRPEAAFEARRQLLLRLWAERTVAEDRERLRAELERAVEALGRRYEWWSMGMATLADLVRQEDAPDSLVEARKIALAAAEAHPRSAGGLQARALVASIEAPGYDLTSMSADGPGRRSIEVRHKNVERLYFRAFRRDLAATVTRAQDYNLLPGYREAPQILAGGSPDAEWSVDLPATPDYRFHRTFVTPPMEAPGLWVVIASARPDFAVRHNHLAALDLVITDLVLLGRPVSERGNPGFEVTVRAGDGGGTLSGVEVSLYRYDWQRGHQRVATRTTGGDGRTRFPLDRDQREGHFLLARRGQDAALDASGVYPWVPGDEEEVEAALVYTDRSVYRPGQEVLWKVVAYAGDGDEGRFRTLTGRRLEVELVDANGQVAASEKVETSAYGSASGRFTVPPGRLLGTWQLRTSLGGATTALQIEEYKRPTFEVTVAEPEAPLRLNRAAELAGEARYYFGLPVTEGAVSWQVTREPLFPPWWGWWGYPAGERRIVASGVAQLTADGTFRVAFTPEADEREAATPGLSYRFRLTADVTDPGGETRSAERVFRLGFVALEVEIASERAFFLAGQAPELTLSLRDLDGAGRAGRGAWSLTSLEQPPEALLPAEQPLPPQAGPGTPGPPRPLTYPGGRRGRRGVRPTPAPPPGGYETPGDRLRPRWDTGFQPQAVMRLWADGEAVAQGEVEHGADGAAKVTLPPLAAGAYRLRYTTTDPFGAELEASRELVVAADGANPVELPALLLAERDSVEVGDTARVLVHSGLPDQEMVLEIQYRNGRLERRRLTSSHGAYVLELPIEAEDRGGLNVRLTALRDYQLMSLDAGVAVPWSDRRLELAFATFRDRLRPGDRETWRITVRGDDEAALGAGAAELLAYMYDRSLDLFAPHVPPDPSSIYPTARPLPPLTSSLGAMGAVWQAGEAWWPIPDAPDLHGDQLAFLSGYGIGGPGRRFGGVTMRKMVAMPESMQTATMEAPMMAADAATGQGGDAQAPPPPPPPPPSPPPPAEVRENFAETAFWEPHLLTGDDGAVTFEFTVPDSVTEWNVWAHAVTRDLRAGSQHARTRSIKELLVRPYLPRFLREGDRAELVVAVNNAAEETLSGELALRIFDPDTGESLLAAWGLPESDARAPFSVPPDGGEELVFAVTVPPGVRTAAVEAVARAGDFSDGELRPLPVLPGRFHLAQSRFTALRDRAEKTLTFAELAAGDDPTRITDQLVVTLDAQLFYSVLAALPYLVDYPYECTEQTLNRYLSTGIVSSVFDDYPAVAKMAGELARRDTRYESWAEPDPNRAMALEETPWLVEARGGNEPPEGLIKVLDPKVAAAQREASLAKLREAQTSLGAFPWWPGGRPSPHMTLYVLNGLSRALEFGLDVPQDVVTRAWAYVHRHYLDEMVRDMVSEDCCWELVTFLNYVLSSYPDASWTGGVFTDAERRTMLEFSMRHWREHSPLLKSYLALTLARAGRADDAERIWESVMDSAKTDEILGTYWAPEERSWLWYNDTVETHAFALRTLVELTPDDPRRHGLVQWLFLNKKLNHWKSTRATAEVIYSLVHYLAAEGALGTAEAATVVVGPRRETFTFEPDAYTGAGNQIVVPGAEVTPAMAEIEVAKETPGLLFASATWHFSTEQLPAEAQGDLFSVTRRYFRRLAKGEEWVLEPLAEGATLAPGDQLEVELTVSARHAAEYVHLRDPRGAGFEPETLTSGYRWNLGIGYYEEVRDSGTNFFFDWLPAGEVVLRYRLRANLGGTFKTAPATMQSMYAPEFTAYSSGAWLTVTRPATPTD